MTVRERPTFLMVAQDRFGEASRDKRGSTRFRLATSVAYKSYGGTSALLRRKRSRLSSVTGRSLRKNACSAVKGGGDGCLCCRTLPPLGPHAEARSDA